MPFPITFTGDLTPHGEDLDTQFSAVGTGLTIFCTAAGANAITLTPIANQAPVAGYGNPNPTRFAFVAAANSTSAVTAQVGSLAFLPVYKPGGTVQAASGTFSSGQPLEVEFVASLNAGSGGFVVVSAIPAGSGSSPFSASFTSAAQNITAAGTLTLAHGLGAQPFGVLAELHCTTGDNNYSIGDIAIISILGYNGSASNQGVSVVADATNLNVRFGSRSSTTFGYPDKTSGLTVGLLNTSWQIVFKAWA